MPRHLRGPALAAALTVALTVVMVSAAPVVLPTTGPLTGQAGGAPAGRQHRPQAVIADLGPGQELHPGHYLTMGSYHLLMRKDGDLVVNDGTQVVWQTQTGGNPGAYAVMQQDGNFVVYSAGGTPLWDTGVAGPGTCLMGSATNSRMVVDTPGDVVGWWPLWSLAPCYTGRGPKVAIVGDSITLLAQYDFPEVLAPHYAYDVSGMAGYEIAQQVPAERAMIDNPLGKAADVIVNLGTNDADHDNQDWQPGLAQILAGVGNRCTIAVTVSDRADADAGVPGVRIASAINDYLRAWAKGHHNVHLLPWSELLREHDYAWVGSDGIHPSAEGDVVLAKLYRQYLSRDCRA